MPQPRLMFYNDGRHPLIYMYEPPIQPEEYEAAVDELLGTPVEALMFCLGDGRTLLHDTQVGELWGHNYKKWPHLIFRRAHQNAKELIRRGHDPLRLLCDRARQQGLLLYPTLLVQQGRGPREVDVRCSEFRFNNAHLEIGAQGGIDPDHRSFSCLDFSHKEVRQERFAVVKEVIDRYPIDGFELQLNYQPYYFRPEAVDEGRALLTEWIADIHRALKKSGPDRELAIRVPASLEGCMQAGLDVEAWLKEGIVDVLIGQAYSGPELLDSMVDFRPLVAAAQGSGCRVHAALQSHIDSDRLAEASIEMLRAAACNYWAQGVDGLYLAHWFGNWPYEASFYEKLREVMHPEVMAPKDKIYFLSTETGRYPGPEPGPGMGRQLPAPLDAGDRVKLDLDISDDVRRWHKAGRVHEVLLRIRVANCTERDRLDFSLNGRPLPPESRRRINQLYRMSTPRYRTGSCYWFIFRLEGRHLPRQGANRLQITLQKRDPAALPQLYVRDVELDIRYLMGKAFHRPDDPDLGPTEPSGM